MEDWKKDRIASAMNGTNPTLLARMRSGFAVIGDTQFLPGYCVLLAAPRVGSLNELNMRGRADFLLDMSLLGDAILKVCKPIKVNYEILINSEDFLHGHLFPRYEWEPEERRKMPVWLYPRENWSLAEYRYTPEKHGELKSQLTEEINRLMRGAYETDREITGE